MQSGHRECETISIVEALRAVGQVDEGLEGTAEVGGPEYLSGVVSADFAAGHQHLYHTMLATEASQAESEAQALTRN